MASFAASLFQAQRFNGGFVDGAGNLQTVIALEIGQGRARLGVQRTGDRAEIVPGFLKRCLDIGDYFVRQQITVGVNGAIVIVVAVERIVAKSRVPTADIEKVVTGADQHNRFAMRMPPGAIVPLVSMAATRIGVTDTILLTLSRFRLVPPQIVVAGRERATESSVIGCR